MKIAIILLFFFSCSSISYAQTVDSLIITNSDIYVKITRRIVADSIHVLITATGNKEVIVYLIEGKFFGLSDVYTKDSSRVIKKHRYILNIGRPELMLEDLPVVRLDAKTYNKDVKKYTYDSKIVYNGSFKYIADLPLSFSVMYVPLDLLSNRTKKKIYKYLSKSNRLPTDLLLDHLHHLGFRTDSW
jgi:hypothetical protein